MSGSYTQVFSGGTITAAYPSYIEYNLTSSLPQITLVWPTEFVSSKTYTSNIIDLTATQAGCSLIMPPANLVSNGQASLFNNLSSYAITLYANDATTVITNLAAGTTTYVYLYNNQTTNVIGGITYYIGSFRSQPFGSGYPAVVSVAAVSDNADLTITGSPILDVGTFTFNLVGDIGAITALSGTGIAVRTGSGTWNTRTITGTANQITVTNGSGVAGNPVISLPAAVSGITSITASNIQIGVQNTNVISTADSNPLTINAPLSLTPIGGVQSALRWYDSAGTNYVAFQGATTIPNNYTWTLPATDGSNGEALLTNGAGILSWGVGGGGGVTSVSGTTNRIVTSPTIGNVVVDISPVYVGQTSITTLGTITTGVWNGTTVTVPYGGTGIATTTSYGLITGGTTSTGNFQNAGTGTAGQIYVSGGNAALGTWTSPSQIGPNILLYNQTFVNAASIPVTGLGNTLYTSYYIILNGVGPVNLGDSLYMQTSTNNGASYDTSAQYSYVQQSTPASSGTTATSHSASGTYILLATDLQSLNLEMYSESFTNSAGYNFSCWGQGVSAKHTAGTQNLEVIMGYNNVSTNVNAFQLVMSTGNINGTVVVYGLQPVL